MPLSTLADSKTFEVDGFTIRPLAAPSRGSAELSLWSMELDPGAQSVAHQMDREEVFLLVTGQVSATISGEEVTAAPGDAIIVPAGSHLQLRNDSQDQPATMTAVTSVGMRATIGDETFAPPWTL